MDKYMKFKVVLVTCLFSVMAYAVAQGIGSVSIDNAIKPLWHQRGLFLGAPSKNPLSDIKNKQSYHLCGTKVYDFPSLGGTGASQPGDTICAESSSLTITGCGFNDRVSLGIDQAKVNAFGTIIPYMSAANTAVVQACAVGITDGGSFNMPDASYTICCDGY